MAFRLEVKFNRLPGMGPAVRKACSDVVRKATFDVEADAKVRAPVDTGFHRSAIQGKMIGPLTGEIVAGAEYSLFLEWGTSKMAAQPALTPAIEAIRQPFIQAIAAAVKRELGAG
jgi:HK97 gp10 family phage protein